MITTPRFEIIQIGGLYRVIDYLYDDDVVRIVGVYDSAEDAIIVCDALRQASKKNTLPQPLSGGAAAPDDGQMTRRVELGLIGLNPSNLPTAARDCKEDV
jgi:hypothetical protein